MGPHQRISRLTDVIRGRWTRERAPKALRAPPAADEAPAQLPVPVTAHSLFLSDERPRTRNWESQKIAAYLLRDNSR